MSELEIQLRLKRDDFFLEVEQTLPADGVTALFGRSGSGKTTLLRCIAGFEGGEGFITFNGNRWLDSANRINVPTHQRGVGYMFQEPRLFPHLDVAGNLNYARQRAPAKATQGRDGPTVSGPIQYEQVVDAFELTSLLGRTTEQLSGGEAQRVALARTLLAQPRLLLLDEPLAALDDALKAELLPFLETLVREFKLPTIYVSHDVEEVARLSSHMLVLSAGRVEAYGPTTEIFGRLDIEEVTGRFDSGALIEGQVVAQDQEWMLTTLQIADQALTLPLRANLRPGDWVRLRVKARDVALATKRPDGLSIRNQLTGVVRALQSDPKTPFAEVLVDLSDHAEASKRRTDSTPVQLRSRITRAAVDDLELKVGTPVYALVKSVTLNG